MEEVEEPINSGVWEIPWPFERDLFSLIAWKILTGPGNST